MDCYDCTPLAIFLDVLFNILQIHLEKLQLKLFLAVQRIKGAVSRSASDAGH